MKRIFWSIVCLLTAFLGAEEVTVETPSARDLKELPAADFLREIRTPLRVDAWGEFTGSVTHKNEQGTRRGTLRVRVTFTPESMHTQIVLNDVNVYLLEQSHKLNAPSKTEFELPKKEVEPGLFQFGIKPDDLTFSFMYWDFVEELPRESSRMNECRVMRLKDPNGTDTVKVLFHAKYGFPMEAHWLKKDATVPWRKMILKGAKRHANGLWFVAEMRLDGDHWKTQVKFDHVELNPLGE